MSGTITLPLPAFGLSFLDPLQGNLTTDGKSVFGSFTINPGIKIDGVEGSQTTIGGASGSTTVENGTASFSANVNILKQSYTFNNGEVLSLQASVSVDEPLRYTVRLTGSNSVLIEDVKTNLSLSSNVRSITAQTSRKISRINWTTFSDKLDTST